MSVELEVEGKTVSEAIINACEQMGVTRNQVDIEVLNEGSKGVLGIGGRPAKVRAKIIQENVSEKGLKAKKVLDDILSYFCEDYSVNLRETADRIKLDVKMSDNRGLIIGKSGEMLKSLEFLIGKISSRTTETGKGKRIYIDIEGYKRRKEDSISKMVRDSVKKVRKNRKPVTLSPMSAYERRITYITLKREKGIRYDTKVDGDKKSITIIPESSNRQRAESS
ncbi:MAG TPA: Jag N-terminal domain-containing protein [Thermodesulfobacteriota bacterium]|jgi:spoIIIJ-associated protein|nr:Jag N-terminal domain-containing protein [Thermodesulfobacteriota bacterium]